MCDQSEAMGLCASTSENEPKEEHLWSLFDEGFADWNGGRPRGNRKPAKIPPGPPVSDYVIEHRR
jgi:hypothetical protein